MLVPPTEPQELQPQVLLQELQPQPVLVPPTEPLQQGLQQEFATKSGNQIPPEELRALQELQELQELQAIKSPPKKDIAETFASTTSYANGRFLFTASFRVRWNLQSLPGPLSGPAPVWAADRCHR